MYALQVRRRRRRRRRRRMTRRWRWRAMWWMREAARSCSRASSGSKKSGKRWGPARTLLASACSPATACGRLARLHVAAV
jgi:hypothetical protein